MTTPCAKDSTSTSYKELDIIELTFKFEELGKLYNLERKRAFEHD
jgi:hypothetical protein